MRFEGKTKQQSRFNYEITRNAEQEKSKWKERFLFE